MRDTSVCFVRSLDSLSPKNQSLLTDHEILAVALRLHNERKHFASLRSRSTVKRTHDFQTPFYVFSISIVSEFIFAPNFHFFMLDPICNPAFCVRTNISSQSSQIYSGWRARASLVANPLFLRFPFILRTPFDCNRSAYKSYSVRWHFLDPLCSFRSHFGVPNIYRISVRTSVCKLFQIATTLY